MFGKILKETVAIIFIPVVIASTRAFLRGLEDISFFNFNIFLFLGGFFAYPIFHIVFFRPMYIYAWGHEIVHVLATWLCAGNVTSFQVSGAGGNVTTSKTNLFIRLSPYFVPIHAIFLFLLYWILTKFCDISGVSKEFVFLAGFTISFHLIMTIEVMKMKQPDILKTGYLFSVFFIYVMNLSVLLLVLSLIFRSVSFIDYAKTTFVLSKNIYLDIFSRLLG